MNSSNNEKPDNESAIDLTEIYGSAETLKHSLISSEKKKDFEPWHHPRKQYVRIRQWCASVQKLIKEVKFDASDAHFSYLTLPGDELLDIRELHGVCEKSGIKLKYIGFNNVGKKTASQTELHLSRNEVSLLTHISEFSTIVEQRFEGISNEQAAAFLKVKQKAPFNAINLDLCDSIASRGMGNPKGSYLDALKVLINLQNQSTKPWLLFLTTRAAPDQVASENAEGFNKAIIDNISKSTDFRTELATILNAPAKELESRLEEMWKQESTMFPIIFSIGLGKWLIHLMASSSPPRELKLESICSYRVSNDWPDMLSFVFKCRAVGSDVQDKFGITKPGKASDDYSEAKVARQYIKDVSEMIDLDSAILSDPSLASKLIDQACNLLESARYETDAYRSWAQSELESMQLSST